ncbi:hypothetical protein TIFTF001_015748 [Ficus carica]|uniref:Dienelactone hydrolase domain-containing protein n=1 Tax=Ficus carica TaxID=3494 RepID=A0AA88D862_FICCA|nr:hypothetical protein TIFTF001_015748 [Ficus carica]
MASTKAFSFASFLLLHSLFSSRLLQILQQGFSDLIPRLSLNGDRMGMWMVLGRGNEDGKAFAGLKPKTDHSTLGTHCTSNPPTLNARSETGHVEKLGSFDSYVTGSPKSKHAIILASDVHGFLEGYQAPNLSYVDFPYPISTVMKLADKIAAAGFFVAVPDFFHGEPFDVNNTKRPMDVWLKDHRPEKAFEEAKPLIKDLKHKGFSAVGAAGFCWGAKLVIELAKLKNFVQATAILHPSFVTPDDIKGMLHVINTLPKLVDHSFHLPYLEPELDMQYQPELIKQFEEVLHSHKINHFAKVYQGVKHGFTIKYDVLSRLSYERAMEAQKDLVKWFIKYAK